MVLNVDVFGLLVEFWVLDNANGYLVICLQYC
jgi:hypothetical protein